MKYFKEGDKVLSKSYGLGVVEQIKENSLLSVGVEFDTGRFEWFTFDGKLISLSKINLYQFDAIIFNENKPIKDEYIPYDFSDAANLIGNVIKHKDSGSLGLITNVCKKGISVSRSGITYQQLLDNYEFQDGSICGKKVE